jgi:hypothetical protein
MNNNSWMPNTAGILNIIAGAFSLIALLFLGIGIMYFSFAEISNTSMHIGASELMIIFWVIAIPKILISILAIVGGVYALKKKLWGLALAGSIAAVLSSFALGVASIIFTIMGKNQFE